MVTILTHDNSSGVNVTVLTHYFEPGLQFLLFSYVSVSHSTTVLTLVSAVLSVCEGQFTGDLTIQVGTEIERC